MVSETMEIGLSTLYCLGQAFPFLLKQLETFPVKHVELVDDGLHALTGERAKALKEVIRNKGLKATVHAPFVDVNIASTDASIRRAVLRRLKKSIFHSSQIGARVWAFHPGLQTGVSHFYPGLDWKLNLEAVRELEGTARQQQIKIAVENVPEPFPFLLKGVKDFARFYCDLDRDDVGMTLDVGHAHISGQVYGFMEKFASRIVHAHLHDNNGDADRHLGIGDGNIDWPEVIVRLERIGYKGILVIESETNTERSLRTLRTVLEHSKHP